jgi:hypothetical protein
MKNLSTSVLFLTDPDPYMPAHEMFVNFSYKIANSRLGKRTVKAMKILLISVLTNFSLHSTVLMGII